GYSISEYCQHALNTLKVFLGVFKPQVPFFRDRARRRAITDDFYDGGSIRFLWNEYIHGQRDALRLVANNVLFANDADEKRLREDSEYG
ncbi:MAG: hypothetical protein ACJ07L_13845, partial [Opitutales bacterium]